MYQTVHGVMDLNKSHLQLTQIADIFVALKFHHVHGVIVGGCARDLILGGEVNDIDLYVHNSSPNLSSFLEELRHLWRGMVYPKSFYEYNAGCSTVQYVWCLEPEDKLLEKSYTRLDVILCSGTLDEYVNSFDFNINQVAWTPGYGFQVTLRGAIAYEHNEVVLLNPNARSLKRWSSLIRKYPYLSIDPIDFGTIRKYAEGTLP